MSGIACLLLAVAGLWLFEVLASCFRPPHRVLCEPPSTYRGRHWAPGVEG